MRRPQIKEKVMPFGEHLEELRRRLIFALWGIVPILIAAFYFGNDVLGLMIAPIIQALQKANLGSTLQATGPLETFMTFFKVALTLTILVSSPWILLQLWLFVAPGLYDNERRFAYILIPLSFLLTVTGVTFCFKVMLPVTLFFLATFGSNIAPLDVRKTEIPQGIVLPTIPVLPGDPAEPVIGQLWFNSDTHTIRMVVGLDKDKHPVIGQTQLSSGGAIAQQYRLSEYVSLLLGFCLAFAVSFQMPVVVLLLGWANIIEIGTLAKYRKHIILLCTVLGAVLTPTPDPFTMFLLAVPLYGLYELGLLLLRVLPAHRVASGFKRRPATDES